MSRSVGLGSDARLVRARVEAMALRQPASRDGDEPHVGRDETRGKITTE